MSGQFWLDWSALAISLLNALLLTWLGLTVMLNAEHRTWGVILAGEGLLTAAAFFITHSVILSQGAGALIRGFSFWWHYGWIPVILSPYAWYILILWYTGFWDDPCSSLCRRQSPWLWGSVVYTLSLGALLAFANPLPDFASLAQAETGKGPLLAGVPLLFVLYPPYIVMCIGLALDALLRPAPSGRVMGDRARRRARPWLTAASLVLLMVSLAVGGVMLWMLQSARQVASLADWLLLHTRRLSELDLGIAALLLGAVLLLGRAIISYEIFTGKTLPRRGFFFQWRNMVALSALIAAYASWSLTARLPSIYVLLPLLVLVAFAYALFSWQAQAEHEQALHRLRPLLVRQRLFEQILKPGSPTETEVDLATPFEALCREGLGARLGVLVPLGPLAALGVPPLRYPARLAVDAGWLAGLLERFDSPGMLGLALDPERHEGIAWALPLWSERGLTGVLLLGEKVDGGFYSQEEVEIARTGGERLADIQASAEMARRLVSLQRQRLVQSQVLDRQARRVLHDDVLPQLHTALLQLSSADLPSDGQEALELLAQAHRRIANLLRDLPGGAVPDLARLGLIGALRCLAAQELANAFDEVTWEIEPQAEQRARELPSLTAEVVYAAAREAMRNAAHHARPAASARPLRLTVCVAWRAGLELSITDDGVGIAFAGPVSEGSGQGLALHSTLMAVVGGSLALESAPGAFTRVALSVPETAAC